MVEGRLTPKESVIKSITEISAHSMQSQGVLI
jgi:hypothetical protein